MSRPKDTDSQSRSRILDSAVDEFAEFGFAGGRVDRIARRAEVNKAMLYYHFDSKENLYRKILTRKIEEISELLQCRTDSGDDLEAILLALSRFYNLHMGKDSRIVAIFLHELASGAPFMKTAFAEMMRHHGIPQKLKLALDKGIAEGKYRQVDARQVIVSFIGMNFYYMMTSPLIHKIWEIEDEEAFRQARPADVVELFMRGIEKR